MQKTIEIKKALPYLALVIFGVLIIRLFIPVKIVGTYSGQGFTNTIDTIKILDNGFYNRIIYSRNKKLIYRDLEKWEEKNSTITLKKFLLNENDLFENTLKGNSSDGLIDVNFLIEKHFFSGAIELNINTDLGYYYRKID